MKKTIVDCPNKSLLEIVLITLIDTKKKMTVYPESYRIELFNASKNEIEEYLFLSSINTNTLSIYEVNYKD